MKKCGLFIAIILFGIKAIYGQDPLLKHYTPNDGLASSTIYRMIQDKEGFIWFGTDAGVTRFDGKKFENYTLADCLSDNEILALKEDSKGRIWFMGFNGTVSYWFNDKIYNASSDTLLKQIVTGTSFVDFFEDSEGRLWFISQSENTIIEKGKVLKPAREKLPPAYIVINTPKGQLTLNNETTMQYLYQQGKISISNRKYQLKRGNNYCVLKNGSVLFPTFEGVVLQIDTIQKLIIPFSDDLKNSPQFGIQLANNLLWMTTINGVYCYDFLNLKAKPIVYLKNKMPCNILTDMEGNIWIGTLDDGLYMIPSWGLKINLYYKGNGLTHNQCFGVHKTSNGDILVGLNKGGLSIISNNKIENYANLFWANIDKAHHIVSLDDNVWIGADSKLIHINRKKNIYHFIRIKSSMDSSLQFVTAVKDISLGKDKIYIAKNYYILDYPINDYSRLNHNETNFLAHVVVQSDYRIYSVYSSYSGELWYGSKVGLESIKNGHHLNHVSENSLLSKRINGMAETEDSTLIIATHGYGLLFYKNGKVIEQINLTSGLSNDICRRLFVHKNKIYVATPSGVSIITYNKKVQSITNLNTGNFLHFNDVNDVYADEEEICIATMNGMAVLKQEAIEKIKLVVPILKIKSITVNDSLVSIGSHTDFTYKQNSFVFNFIGIYFQVPSDVNYRYRLKEDNAWIVTKSNVLEFPYLPPGEYNFEVQARVKNGEWSEMKKYSFIIEAPFWQRVWFILLLVAAAVALIYLGVKYRVKAIRKQHDEKARIEKQISDLEQQALQTMMNPHFIFNVMNSIQYFINNNDKKAANQYLSDFAKLIRMNLTISYKRHIPLEEEIDYLRLYLSFEKLRFGDKLNYEIIIDPLIDTSDTPVAVMMIQPFLENAIWHGILQANASGWLSLEIKKESDELLKITIKDNGIGIKDEFIGKENLYPKKESHGLNMTLQRLKLLGNMSGQELYIRFSHIYPSEKLKGTMVEMLLPTTM